MFPLPTKSLPTSAAELATAIRQSLQGVLTLPDPAAAVTLTERSFPALDSLDVNLTNATCTASNPPPAPKPTADRAPGITLARLRVAGHPIYYEKSKADLQLDATDVKLDLAHDAATGNALLVLTDAAHGKLDLDVTKEDLRALLLAAATTAAKSQGVTIQDLDLTLTSEGPRTLSAEVRVKAKKMIMSGTVTLRGRASIDDDLTATLSNLAATGDGMIGNLAAGLIQSKLQPHEGKRIPLMTFSLGEVTLRDLQITTTPTLHLSATFGRATE